MSADGRVDPVNSAALKARVRRLASKEKSSVSDTDGRAPAASGLQARVAQLELDMQEQRALSLRIAQLTDIVQELLIPVADRDEEKLKALLDTYSSQL